MDSVSYMLYFNSQQIHAVYLGGHVSLVAQILPWHVLNWILWELFSLCLTDNCWEAPSPLLGATEAPYSHFSLPSPLFSYLKQIPFFFFFFNTWIQSSCWTKGLRNSEETFDKCIGGEGQEWSGRSQRKKKKLGQEWRRGGTSDHGGGFGYRSLLSFLLWPETKETWII